MPIPFLVLSVLFVAVEFSLFFFFYALFFFFPPPLQMDVCPPPLLSSAFFSVFFFDVRTCGVVATGERSMFALCTLQAV